MVGFVILPENGGDITVVFLVECRVDLSVSMLIVNTSDLSGVTHPFSRSPDGNNVAKTTGERWTYPGRNCSYANGVKGRCLPDFQCRKEEQEASGYNSTWKCPEHKNTDLKDRICFPFLGEENSLAEGGTLSNSNQTCRAIVFFCS